MPQGFARLALPDTMSAVQLTGHGGFECLRHVSHLRVPPISEGEVLVRVRAAAVNNTDLNLRSGWYSKSTAHDPAARAADAGWGGQAVRVPLIQGADGCGHVVALGAGVDATLLGRRVLLDPIIRRKDKGGTNYEYLGTDRDGCFAEYVVVPAANAVPVHSGWSDAELASFPCSYLAAENMLERAGVGATDTVLVSGASGGVGTAAIQLARRRGAQVIALLPPRRLWP
jgi:NADPH:quinone reductase-like Zn-dependent oxidoreductase